MYDVHCQQKLATPHTRDRCAQLGTEKMKPSFIHIILIILIGFGCNGKKELNSIIENQPIEEINEENVPNELTKKDSEREEYYRFDTFTYKGNLIEVQVQMELYL